ncbi:LysR family transcriptional regulator [Bosea sp. BIWAKO-01]|uniref:LysR family transcriptional regulator n=1 Tax=Bosea sp. BIWAKO-01 TaxID=506668 RepID=UPI00114CE82B|nr:LysR family transcriptional regulator [Bosea sp. BIWAKO-01]
MDLRHLEAFVAVATLGSFKAAGNRLRLTQPAISSRIQSLETALGEELFVRNVRPARLTDLAKRILPLAQEMLELSLRISPSKTSGEARRVERLRLGLNSSLVSYWSPLIFDRLRSNIDNISIVFDVDISQHLIEKMRGGMLDICLMHAASDIAGMRRHFVRELRTIWVARAGLVPGNRLSTEELVGYNLFTFGPDSPSRTAFDAHLRAKNLWPTPYHVSNHADVIINQIKWGKSIGLLIHDSVRHELERGELVELQTEFKANSHPIWICHPITKSNSLLNQCVGHIIKFVSNDLDR